MLSANATQVATTATIKMKCNMERIRGCLTNVTRQKHNLPVVPDIHGKETVGQKSISYH